MDDIMRMTVLECAHNLLKEASSLVFGHLASSHNVLKQLARQILYHHYDIRRRINHIVPEPESAEISPPLIQQVIRCSTHSLIMWGCRRSERYWICEKGEGQDE